jgi:quercetin dioxygenase-like cupin family protein
VWLAGVFPSANRSATIAACRQDYAASFSFKSIDMAVAHAKSGEVIDVRPLGAALPQARTTALIKTEALEIVRLVIPAGKEIPQHQTRGEITVQCLEGRVTFTAEGESRELHAGQLLYLAREIPHSLRGIEDASILVTILLR